MSDDKALPPIVTDENGDIGFYASLADAELELEAADDVRDGVYEVFDSVGHRLLVVAEGEVVQIRRDPNGSADPEELASRLRRFVGRVGPTRIGLTDPEGTDLQGLVDALSAFFGLL